MLVAVISWPVTEVNLLLNLAAVSGTRGRRRRKLVVASSANQALNLCAHHPHIIPSTDWKFGDWRMSREW